MRVEVDNYSGAMKNRIFTQKKKRKNWSKIRNISESEIINKCKRQ